MGGVGDSMDWVDVDQHPGRGCCESCMEDVAYDPSYRVGDYLCCCRSEVDTDNDTPEGVVAFALARIGTAPDGDEPEETAEERLLRAIFEATDGDS